MYNAASHAQLESHAIARPAITSALERLSRNELLHSHKDNSAFEALDLGCGPGSNAIAFGEYVLDQFRNQFGNRRPVRWTFSDLASNDWSALVQLVAESEKFSAPDARVFATAHGANFYDPCAPPSSGAKHTISFCSYIHCSPQSPLDKAIDAQTIFSI